MLEGRVLHTPLLLRRDKKAGKKNNTLKESFIKQFPNKNAGRELTKTGVFYDGPDRIRTCDPTQYGIQFQIFDNSSITRMTR